MDKMLLLLDCVVCVGGEGRDRTVYFTKVYLQCC